MRKFLLMLALLPSVALAQSPHVELQGQSQEIHFTMIKPHLTLPGDDELMLEPMVVTFTHVTPESIEHRFTRDAAIGDGGPHADLGIQSVSAWKKLPYEMQGDKVHVVLQDVNSLKYTRPDSEASLVPSSKMLAKAVEETWGVRDQQVTCPSVESGNCYTYRSENRFRFRGTDGKQYDLSLRQTGGC